jgi:capsular exopolysaccharide synthesis family protein
MSLIFDALQRSEGDRSGVNLSSLTVATDLLQRVENQAVTEWKTAGQPESLNTTENAAHEESFLPQEIPLIAPAVESRKAAEVPVNSELLNQLARFPSIQVSIPPDSQLVGFTESESMAAEKFRFLGVRLRHLRRERPLQKVLITSTIPHEGKSMVSANLACTLARKRLQRTLLVEGDLRRPSILPMFGLEKLPGICEWLQGGHTKIENIFHLAGPDLWVLPAGNALSNPLELLQSGKLPALMDQLTSLFDWVIIDSPPVLPLADTSVWSRLADGILLVTRQGTTEKRHLQKGIEALDHKKVIGALLNCSQSSSDGDDYYYSRPSAVSGSDNQTVK